MLETTQTAPTACGSSIRGEPLVIKSDGLRLVGDRWRPAKVTADSKGSLILLHGGGQRRHSWHRTGIRMAEDGWTVIALDARGHGDSEWSPSGDYSTDALIRDLRAVVHTLNAPPVLVGASMGGMTALVGQGESGDLAGALVLVDIVPKVEPAGLQRIMNFMAGAPDGFRSLQEVADAVHHYNPHRSRPPSLDGLRRNVRQRPNGRWYWHWDPALLQNSDDATRRADYERARAAAAKITLPTLLLRGSQSDIVSNEGVAELRELIPSAEHVDITSASHMVAGDDNDIFTGQLNEFLSRNRTNIT